MTLVIDTNVLYQALRNRNGASHFILNLIRNRKVRMAISVPVFAEYQDVLSRKKSLKEFGLTLKDLQAVIEFIAYIGVPFSNFFAFRPNLRDENDNMFVELALTCNADYIVTNNIKDFVTGAELKFNDLRVITPSEFVKLWKEQYEK